jgi:hypothetical protein
MSDTNDLAERAKHHVLADQSVATCWSLVVRGIEAGWLDDEELRALIQHLREHRDFGVEELLFAHVGDRLRVSFLDDRATCAEAPMIEALAALSAAPHQ